MHIDMNNKNQIIKNTQIMQKTCSINENEINKDRRNTTLLKEVNIIFYSMFQINTY